MDLNWYLLAFNSVKTSLSFFNLNIIYASKQEGKVGVLSAKETVRAYAYLICILGFQCLLCNISPHRYSVKAMHGNIYTPC